MPVPARSGPAATSGGRIDDPRHADHWRGWHVGRSSQWFEDALSCHEATASALLGQVFRRRRQLLLCGDSTLALAILRELSRRAWERQELAGAEARGSGLNGHPASNGAGPPTQHPAGPLPVQRVLLLDRRAEDLRREYLATSPAPLVEALCEVTAEPNAWQDELLALLDRMPAADAAGTTVVVADAFGERGVHEAGRVARLHQDIPVFLLTSDGPGTTGAIFDLLQPFQRALLVDGEVPEDSWTRVARHWHECYRLSHPPDAADPRTLTGRPWTELDDFIRQDNVLQLRSIMTAVVGRGRRWVPDRAVAPGSFIELGEHDLLAIAQSEHARWFQRRVAAGWSAGDARLNGSPAGPTAGSWLPGQAPGSTAGWCPGPRCPKPTRPRPSSPCDLSSPSWRTPASCRSCRPAAPGDRRIRAHRHRTGQAAERPPAMDRALRRAPGRKPR